MFVKTDGKKGAGGGGGLRASGKRAVLTVVRLQRRKQGVSSGEPCCGEDKMQRLIGEQW